MPDDSVRYLSSARSAASWAASAGVASLLLTHLWPGSDQDAAMSVARESYAGDVGVASAGMAIEVS